jgi:5-methyltetrahydropteroyltriglutamate--homocysteine methyltransferase
MSAHSRSVGSSITSWDQHLPLAIEAINEALSGIPKEKVRLHLCWGNYAGPHQCDVGLDKIIGEVIKANVGTIYPEGGNPRHEHEWRVFRDTEIPADMKVILGTIDTKTNYIEHPQVVADRLVRVGQYIGADRLLAGTDCGFDTFIKFSQVDPDVAWHKLRAMSDGAELASEELS